MAREFKLLLANGDYAQIKQLAKELNLTDTEVLRNGLKFMSLYAKTVREGSALIVKENDKQSKIVL